MSLFRSWGEFSLSPSGTKTVRKLWLDSLKKKQNWTFGNVSAELLLFCRTYSGRTWSQMAFAVSNGAPQSGSTGADVQGSTVSKPSTERGTRPVNGHTHKKKSPTIRSAAQHSGFKVQNLIKGLERCKRARDSLSSFSHLTRFHWLSRDEVKAPLCLRRTLTLAVIVF